MSEPSLSRDVLEAVPSQLQAVLMLIESAGREIKQLEERVAALERDAKDRYLAERREQP